MGDIEDEGAPVGKSFKEFGEAYGAPMITVELSMGHRKGALLESAKGLATGIFNMFSEGDVDLRSLKAKVKTQDDVPTEEINLIDEVLSDRFDVDLPANDPDKNYKVRDDFIKQILAEH